PGATTSTGTASGTGRAGVTRSRSQAERQTEHSLRTRSSSWTTAPARAGASSLSSSSTATELPAEHPRQSGKRDAPPRIHTAIEAYRTGRRDRHGTVSTLRTVRILRALGTREGTHDVSTPARRSGRATTVRRAAGRTAVRPAARPARTRPAGRADGRSTVRRFPAAGRTARWIPAVRLSAAGLRPARPV